MQGPQTIQCPNCRQNLLQGSTRCQFCGTPLQPGGPVSTRGVVILTDRNHKPDRLTWQEYGYIICSSLVILFGVLNLLIGLGIVPTIFPSIGGSTFFEMLGMFYVVMGAALLMQQIWAQFIMKWVAILAILDSLRGLAAAFMLLSLGSFALGAVTLALSFLGFAYNGFLIYFIVQLADV